MFDERSNTCSQFILPGLGLPTAAPPPFVQLVSASTSQSQDCSSIQGFVVGGLLRLAFGFADLHESVQRCCHRIAP